MTKPKVLISDKMDPNAARIFEERGCDVDVKPGMTPDELKAVIGQYDGLAIRSATKVTPEILDAAENLKVIGRAGIGVDNVDIPYASGKGVVVMNTPFGNSITTAEHAIALIMAVARQIPAADARTQKGEWPKSDFMGVEVTGKTLGLIGAGNIGSIVASRAQGLRMKVIAYDPFLTEDRAIELGIEKVDLDTLLARADFITLHTPLTDETRNILSRENLAKTKQGVRIVNCARGGLIDEEALKDLLESGHVAGAALDVFANEPAKESPLFGTPGFISTPHLGASTTEAQVNVALQVAEQMAAVEIHRLVQDLRGKIELMASYKKAQKAAQGWLTASWDLYDSGFGSFRDVMDALVQFYRRKVGYLQAVHEHNLLVYELSRAVGADITQLGENPR